MLCCCISATILSCGWIIYLTYYNSRNIGLILTLIINRLYKDGYIHIGVCSSGTLSHSDSEEERCQSFQFKALTQSAEYFMMSRLLSVIIAIESEQQTATNARLNFST